MNGEKNSIIAFEREEDEAKGPTVVFDGSGMFEGTDGNHATLRRMGSGERTFLEADGGFSRALRSFVTH